jgi:TPR repeat protein
LGVERNTVLARECFLKACEEGNILAKARFARSLEGEEDHYSWYEKAAQDGDADGCFWAGDCCEDGNGVEMDKAKAFEWYWKGAQQKNNRCLSSTGRCYKTGIGCVKDFRKAAFYYLEAEDSFDIYNRLTSRYDEDEITLQELFFFGRGLKKNEKLRLKVEKEGLKGVTDNCIRIFEESCSSARKAALCIIWIFQRKNLLIRDLRKLIGEMIWKSREDPAVLGVSLIKGERK